MSFLNSRQAAFVIYLPAVLTGIYILTFGTNVPLADQWDFVRLLEMVKGGTASFHDIWVQHNEHRIFFPKLIMIVLASITGYNVVAEMLFTWLILIAFYIYIAKAHGTRVETGYLLLVSLFVFSWVQAENLLWGFQIGLTLPILCAFAALFHLSRFTRKHFVIAIIYAIVGSFSSSMGLLIWLAGLVTFVAACGVREKKLLLLAWASVGVITWVIYFSGYHSPGDHPSLMSALGAPWALLKFFFALAGAWAVQGQYSIIVGAGVTALLLLALFFILRNKTAASNSLWLGFAVFCFGTLAVIALGRSPLGIEFAYTRSAYTTYSLGLVIACLFLMKRCGGGSIYLMPVVIAYAVVLVIHGYWEGLRIGISQKRSLESLIPVLVDYRDQGGSELKNLCPNIESLRKGADFLEANRLSVFASHPAHEKTTPDQTYMVGDAIMFGLKGNARPYLGEGWSIDEPGFVWLEGKQAVMNLQIAKVPTIPVELEIISAMTLTGPGLPAAQRMRVSLNGVSLGEVSYQGAQSRTLTIPANVWVMGKNNRLQIDVPDATKLASTYRSILSVAVYMIKFSERP